jgi:hypothetical protein
MVDKARRKELLQQYSERPSQNGVFTLRNAVTGEVWVGVSRNLDTQHNGLWTRLSNGMLINKDVQTSWKTHGKAAFSYEIVERFTETDPYVIERLRLERAEHWRTQLDAGTVKGT